ncbi:DUSAM domain-containing protein [Corallococcus sicarius]|nr:DUSAM domain-containing protein [Corallococcus sicarius]
MKTHPRAPERCGATKQEAEEILFAVTVAMELAKPDLPEWKRACINNYVRCKEEAWSGSCYDCFRHCEGQQGEVGGQQVPPQEEGTLSMAEDVDWEEVRRLAARVEAGEALTLTSDVRELLLRAARQVAIPDADALVAVNDVATATTLLREARARIREGSIRLSRTRLRADDLARNGDVAGARKLLEDLLAVEEIPLYRELAEIELEGLD